MPRLYFVPQLPVKNRYPEEWINWYPREFKKAGFEVHTVVGKGDIPVTFGTSASNLFTDLNKSITWELEQIHHLTDVLGELTAEDIIFFADLDFPGFVIPFIQLIKLQSEVRLFGFQHAGSYCHGDLFTPVQQSKRHSEMAMFDLLDGIFVATDYHKRRLIQYFGDIHDSIIHIVGAPLYPDEIHAIVGGVKPPLKRSYDAIYTARIDRQRGGDTFLQLVRANPTRRFLCTRYISDPPPNLTVHPTQSRAEYYTLLNDSRLLLSTSTEDTFGYGVVEAMALGVIPLVPNRFSYPETVSDPQLRYENDDDLHHKFKELVKIDSPYPRTDLIKSARQWERSIPRMIKVLHPPIH